MSVATRFFQLLCNKAIPVSRTGMTKKGGYSDDRRRYCRHKGTSFSYFHDIVVTLYHITI
ncbi:hypothetical protein HCR08_01940 [Wolbachia pipientis]|uniref:hypothetical protein n=1 Tax=Wolbachia pipientis TaxID=955 RepID=UPI0015F8B15F|nr:hypothetical protein [Wolbachia pipientis]MBA8754866.1 hypothetical protein [Wolbachia pipientis]